MSLSNVGNRLRGRRRCLYDMADDCYLGFDDSELGRYGSECKKNQILLLYLGGHECIMVRV